VLVGTGLYSWRNHLEWGKITKSKTFPIMPCLEAKLNYLRAFIFGLLSVLAVQALAATPAELTGDAAHGKAISTTCATCHGAEGKAIMPAYPNLAGQHPSYIVRSLLEYKKGPQGQRNNPIMMAMAMPLSDQDIADLAAYYGSLAPITGEADPSLVERGAKIYRGGIMAENVPACTGCHGPKGEGAGLAKFPSLAGQNADYLVAQLMAFKAGERKGPNGMMAGVTHHMSPADMAAVASYIQGLQP
jgi:cbb3-type cytochrome c oxidase subunit III